jgi:hypothetical protein
MTIYFKSGKTVQISEPAVRAITEKLKKGCNDWQSFTDEKTGEVLLVIKLSEVEYIQ